MNNIRNNKSTTKALVASFWTILLVSAFLAGSPKTIAADFNAGNLPQESLLLSDGQFVYGPNVNDFNCRDFLLQNTTLSAEDANLFKGAALQYSINPRVLLTIFEIQSNFFSNPSQEAIDSPVGYGSSKGFASQVEVLSETLYETFYWYLYRYQPRKTDTQLPMIRFEDSSPVRISSETNAATYAILTALAELSSAERWQKLVSKDTSDGFYQTYLRLFPGDDPLDSTNLLEPNEVPPADLLKLPFACNDTWQFTSGPHGGDSVWPAIDFSPVHDPCSSPPPAGRWVVAAASGVVFDTCGTCSIGIDHGVEGWQTFYYHLSNPQVTFGDNVVKNQPIGNPSCSTCCGGTANGHHVHFDIRKNGLVQNIEGTSLEGWIVHAGVNQRDGYLQKGSEIKNLMDWVPSVDCSNSCCCSGSAMSGKNSICDNNLSPFSFAPFRPAVTTPTPTDLSFAAQPPVQSFAPIFSLTLSGVEFTPTPIDLTVADYLPAPSNQMPNSISKVREYGSVDIQPAMLVSTNYQILKSVFGTSGGRKTSTNYILQSTSGQSTGVGQLQNNSFILQSGYWAMSLKYSTIFLPIVVNQYRRSGRNSVD